MTTITTLTLLIIIYLLSDKTSNYTLLSKYTWYDNLFVKLYGYEGKVKTFLTKLYYNKLFTCKSCNVFWISLVTYSILGSILPITTDLLLIYPLIIFLIHKAENNV